MRSRLKIREFHVLLFPPLFWLIVFFAVPLLIVLIYSVSYRGTYGGVIPGFTLEHYRHLFDPLYVRVFGRSVLIATQGIDRNVWLGGRNIPKAVIKPAAEINAYDVLSTRIMVITKAAFEDVLKTCKPSKVKADATAAKA